MATGAAAVLGLSFTARRRAVPVRLNFVALAVTCIVGALRHRNTSRRAGLHGGCRFLAADANCDVGKRRSAESLRFAAVILPQKPEERRIQRSGLCRFDACANRRRHFVELERFREHGKDVVAPDCITMRSSGARNPSRRMPSGRAAAHQEVSWRTCIRWSLWVVAREIEPRATASVCGPAIRPRSPSSSARR
jgi:hypothetical protein